MTTAILSALPEEQAGLVHALAHPQRITRAGRSFWRGELHGRSVVLALSGIGKVAAATTATALVEHFGVARIVFTGVAGGLGDGVNVGDVVVAQSYLQHDMDASPLFPRWELPGYARAVLECDAPLSALLLIAARDCLMGGSGHCSSQSEVRSVHQGLIASGDRFVSSAQESQRLRDALRAAGHEVLAVEMEGAAVAQVCLDYNVPFAAMRTISDRADDSAHVDFPQFIQTVASRYAEHIVGKLLQLL
ncbi:S-adenosylhomocysteine nucleosidase [Acidovorax sp. Leaf76]|uniref:5'-methylthioadenosine/adenosylhomocysteine nucleosidase n=1 Tax=unclassified Acidovorax TaxID=2684926 RepID=UPI0006F496F2|nr:MULTISPECIES: 5'-methylthioadenosine/adenosylhomocysteine nucleosidase [unclassified Acidovorax]KQO26953.1 S-adenosylhomocysteine nucleosidase [Acidovorax sp. Leaf76]KQO40721.1 S-adenosylhomocysteine nucleosidase [Acidovorax sp. Leaf84]KQS42866.1 S-adenosylhomocysteine nucleosidase [Acidovorax sp. Leaf191]